MIIWRIIDDALRIIDEVALAITISDVQKTSGKERSTNSNTDA